jgi:hypothetical protein
MSTLVSSVCLSVLAECCFIGSRVIIKLTRRREGGNRRGGIGEEQIRYEGSEVICFSLT